MIIFVGLLALHTDASLIELLRNSTLHGDIGTLGLPGVGL